VRFKGGTEFGRRWRERATVWDRGGGRGALDMVGAGYVLQN